MNATGLRTTDVAAAKIARALALLSIVACLFAMSSGCGRALSASRAGTPTGGVELEMYVRDETGAEVLYTVNRQGELGFGGGMDARMGNTSWTGQMTAEQIDMLLQLLDDHGWYTRKPRAAAEPSDALYRVELRGARGPRTIKLTGRSPDIQPVEDMLEELSLQRLHLDLQRLPQPGLQTR